MTQPPSIGWATDLANTPQAVREYLERLERSEAELWKVVTALVGASDEAEALLRYAAHDHHQIIDTARRMARKEHAATPDGVR